MKSFPLGDAESKPLSRNRPRPDRRRAKGQVSINTTKKRTPRPADWPGDAHDPW
jgi:hypothetical protein